MDLGHVRVQIQWTLLIVLSTIPEKASLNSGPFRLLFKKLLRSYKTDVTPGEELYN